MLGAAASGGPVPRHLVVARVRKPHGIKGELSVSLETDRPEAVFREGRRLWIGSDPEVPSQEVEVERGRPFKGGYLVKLVGFDQRDESVEGLRGSFLLMQREEAEEAGEDEIPHHELIGMQVIHGDREVGEVVDLYELGWAEMLVIRRGERETLVPLVREMVARVDRDAGVLELDPPSGLLDL